MKLIANDITHLTDARYFAAMGSQFIGFNTVRSSIEQVNTMKNWVDVPGFYIRFTGEPTPDQIWEWCGRTGITTLLVDELTDDMRHLFPDMKWMQYFDGASADYDDLSHIFIREDDMDSWNEFREQSTIEADTFIHINPPFHQRNYSGFTGIVLSGTEEDKTGVKAYDDIDQLLDGIEIDY